MYTTIFLQKMALVVLVATSHGLRGERPPSFGGISKAIHSVLDGHQPYCSVIFITRDFNLHMDQVIKELKTQNYYMFGIFEIKDTVSNGTDSDEHINQILARARQIRLLSKCVLVVVVKLNEVIEESTPLFLGDIAEKILIERLLVWSSKLFVITNITLNQVQKMMKESWTYSMMNAALLNLQNNSQLEGLVYVSFPYGPSGSQVEQVASWSELKDLRTLKGDFVHQDKYSNFYGAKVNVTALPYTPHWMETIIQNSDGSKRKIYDGTDFQLLSTIAYALNFSINVMETSSWDEVATRVEERASFMATVFHNILPQRLERYDYSYTYEYGSLDFSVAKPALKPQWQSLYYPLTDGVWLSLLVVLLIIPLVLHMTNDRTYQDDIAGSSFALISQTVFGTLLGQPMLKHVPKRDAFRIALGTWLVFTFIIGTAYRGNLTASLTIPKYPPRVETVQQLVNTFDRITMPPFGNEFIKFFRQSDNQLYKRMAQQMSIVPSVIDGLQQAVEEKEAHVAGRRYMEQTIAKHFSNPDGSTKLYVGRESILPGISAWPIPHDAPYRQHIDRLMMTVIEGGLYEMWSEVLLRRAQGESRKRAREYREKNKEIVISEGDEGSLGIQEESSQPSQALTIVHMQGPIILLLLGLITGIVIFLCEILTFKFT